MDKEIKRRIIILGIIAVLLIIGGSVVSLTVKGVITITDTLSWFIVVMSIVVGFIGLYNLIKLWFLFREKNKGGLPVR
jgi:hypothetical protein